MSQLTDKELRDRCQRRLNGMTSAREPWLSSWRSVAEYTQPAVSRWLTTGDKNTDATAMFKGGKPKLNTKLQDGTGIRAANVLQNGMHTGLTSPVRKWFRMTTLDPDLRENQEAKEWLNLVEQQMEEWLARSNAYGQIHGGYGQLGRFGVEAGLLWNDHNGLIAQALSVGEYYAAVGANLAVDTLYRACPMTAAQMMRFFAGRVSRKVREAYDKSDYDTVFPVVHAMEPNTERESDKLDNRNMRWSSVYWEPGEHQEGDLPVNDVSGFDMLPGWCARWEPMGNQPYSISPGMQALGDMRQLARQMLALALSADMANQPPIVVPESMRGKLNMNPKGVTFAANNDIEKIRNLFEAPSDPQWIMKDVERTQGQVSDAFYEPLFKAILNLEREVTAYQTAQLNQEKYAQLGPVIEATGNEKLRPIIDVTFAIMARANALPPIPNVLRGHELRIEFVSTLAQLQRSDEIGSLAQTAQFVGSFVAIDQGASDKLDIDKAIDLYADLQGTDPSVIRSEDAVQALRDQRAKAQQAAQLQAAAPAAKDLGQAASTLADIDPSKLAQLGVPQAA